MAKLNISPDIKRGYNRARKSYLQKIGRAEKRGYQFYTGAKMYLPSLSKLIEGIGNVPKDFLEYEIKEQTKIIENARINLYSNPNIEYHDTITGLTFSGTTGKEIENERNKTKFLKKGDLKDLNPYERNNKEYRRLYSYSIEAYVAYREYEERKQNNSDIEYKENPRSEKKERQEISPEDEFYSDRNDRGTDTANEPSRIDQIINTLSSELDRATGTSDKHLSDIQSEIQGWTPIANWTPTLLEVKEKDVEKVTNIVNSLISDYGREQIALNAEKNAGILKSLLQEILYASGSKEGNFRDGRTRVNYDIVAFKELLGGYKMTAEESAYYTERAERNELYN